MNDLERAICSKIFNGGSQTLAELSEIPGFKGNLTFASGKDNNVIFWTSLSQDAVDAIIRLCDQKVIRVEPAHILEYAVSGQVLKLPLVIETKRKKTTPYRKPHWFPVKYYLDAGLPQ